MALVSVVPSSKATLRAFLIGFIIPIASCIIPIVSALNKELARSLDLSRSKVDGVIISIKDTNKPQTLAYLTFGLLTVVYGVSIYVLLPLSLLTLKISLLLIVFLAILLGMLFGLVLIAFNFQRSIELAVTYLLFFWERKSMR